jgi:HKD family nuclease
MQAFLSEDKIGGALQALLRKAGRVKTALALVSQAGLEFIADDLNHFLARGGKIQLLLGVDMSVEPRAIATLMGMRQCYPAQVVMRRFVTDPASTFHPKMWIFSPTSGRSTVVVGSSNLTFGGLDRNYEANIQVDDVKTVSEFKSFFDELFEGGRAKQIDQAWLKTYAKNWQKQQAARKRLLHLQEMVRSIRTRDALRTPVPRRIRGHSFAFSGGIADWPRLAKLYPTITHYGGRVVEFEGMRRAECLVHGDTREGPKTTRKLSAARREGIEVISQTEFLEILENEKLLRKRNPPNSL